MTYNEENLPEHGSLVRAHLQQFIKNLRRKIEPLRIKFFACGEYGKKFERPHYHICIFGWDPNDKESIEINPFHKNPFSKAAQNFLYKSEFIAKIWKKGFVSIGSVTFESAAYTARYICKKINGDKSFLHYGKRTPEFSLMSRKGGIGITWLMQYFGDVYPKDFFTINGKRIKPPKFYDRILKKIDPELLQKLREKRQGAVEELEHKMRILGLSIERENYRKHVYTKTVTKQLNRRLENA